MKLKKTDSAIIFDENGDLSLCFPNGKDDDLINEGAFNVLCFASLFSDTSKYHKKFMELLAKQTKEIMKTIEEENKSSG